MKILLLEDDLVDQMAFRRWMTKELADCNLVIAGDIKEGKRILSEQQFNFIVCDFFLPDGDVFDFIKEVDPAKVVCISGGNDPDHLKKIKASGISHFFFKDNQLNYLNDFKNFVLQSNNKAAAAACCQTSPTPIPEQPNQLESLKRAFDHNPEPIKEVIQIFLRQTPPQLVKLRKAVLDRNSTTCFSISHRLKSSFRMMGLYPQMEMLKEIENQCCQEIKDHQYFINLVDRIQNDSTQAFKNLRKELEIL